MSQDVTVTPMIITIDIVQNAIDMQSFVDYLRSHYKREVVFLNGNDFSESNGRISKSDSKSTMKQRHDGSPAIVRGLRTKIDNDMNRALDAKKKLMIAIEKAKNNPKSQRSKSKLSVTADENPIFEGMFDVLYVIINYPYLPKQLTSLLEGGVDLSAFVAFVPKENNDDVPYVKKEGLVTTSKQPAKKNLVQGSELDWTQNPNCYPPARWTAIRPTAPSHVAFLEIVAENNNEANFKHLEESVVKNFKAKSGFNDFFKDYSIHNIPASVPNCSLTNFIDYISERPGDFVNAVYYELRTNKFKTVPPPPPPPLETRYGNLFDEGFKELDRRVVFLEPRELNDVDFNLTLPSPLHPLLYRINKWALQSDKAEACKALCKFLSSQRNIYAYAGQKFDSIVSSANKKYSLGLPLSFFDWSQWNFSTDYLQVGDQILEAIHGCDIIETFFDDTMGILWILTLPPITRTIGQFFTNYSMPPMIEGMAEYIDQMFDKDFDSEKRSRKPPTPASLIRDNLDINILLPSLPKRFADKRDMYKLPLSISNSAMFTSPYYFESGLKVDIQRLLINGKIDFNYNVYFKSLFDVFSSSEAIVIQPIEGIRIMIENSFIVTILFNEQSIRYSKEGFMFKSTGEPPILILPNGTFIMNENGVSEFNSKDQEPMIIEPNGTITKCKNNKWTSCNAEGESFLHTQDGNLLKENKRHSEISDLANQTKSIIRPDETEYYVKSDGTRRMLFSHDFSIEQNEKENKILYDLPNFPVINKEGDKFVATLDLFEMKFEQDKVTINCPYYSIEINEEYTFITDYINNQNSTTNDSHINEEQNNISEQEATEMFLKTDHCEFKYQDKVIIADKSGIERYCVINNDSPTKKRVENYQTHWGRVVPLKETLQEQQQNSLNRKFLPRFFAVKTDLTVTEFMRRDTINTENEFRSYEDTISSPSGEECQIKSFHHPEKPPSVYIVNEPLSKVDRANILKGVRIPKKPRAKKTTKSDDKDIDAFEEEVASAESERQNWLYDYKIFMQTINNRLEKKQIAYEEEIAPPEIPPPEELSIPPQTPNPRLLEMAANKYQASNIDQMEPGSSEANYWNSFEATFAMPLDEPKTLPRPLSPRVNLHDPPRFFKKEKKEDKPDYEMELVPSYTSTIHSPESAFQSQPRSSRNSKLSAASRSVSVAPPSKPKTSSAPRSRPMSVKATPDTIDFGRVKPETSSVCQMTITNTGTVPIHFSVSQTTSPYIKVLTIPGVIYPGLKVTLKVALLPSPPQNITTSFEMNTKEFTLHIPVVAIIE